MRHHASLALGRWLIALLLLFGWREQARVHECALHGASRPTPVAAHEHHGAGAHVPDKTTQHPCRCAGDCCGVARVILPRAATLVVSPVVRVVQAPRPLVGLLIQSRQAHELPFANGPPPA